MEICIYGCGFHGINTYFELKKYGIYIDYFVDKNEKKIGYILEGKKCISYSDMLKKNKKTEIIVAIDEYQNIVRDFRILGFENAIGFRDKIACCQKQSDNHKNRKIIDVDEMKILKKNISDGMKNCNLSFDSIELEEIIKDYWYRNYEYCRNKLCGSYRKSI